MQDPGFLAGLIGWAIGWAMSGILHRIKIVYFFRERLEGFQSFHQSISSSTIGKEKWLERHFERASDIVNNGSKVSWFNVIKRYQMSKSIPELILNIQSAGSLLRFESMVKKLSHEPTAISPPQPPPSPKCEPKSSPAVFEASSSLAASSPAMSDASSSSAVFEASSSSAVFEASSSSAHPVFTPPPPEFTPPLPPPVFRPPSSPPAFLPLQLAEEETPSQGLLTEEETPSQALQAEEVDSTDHNDLDFSSKKNYKSLEHLLRTINPTMEMVEKIFLRGDNTDSAVAWYKLLRELLEKAKDLIDQRDKTSRLDFFRQYRYEVRIQSLTSRINDHLRLFPFLEMMPASSNDPRESYFHLFSNNPRGS